MNSRLPNVLYLSADGLTDPLGQSQILPYLVGLSSSYAITVVTFDKKKRFKLEKNHVEKICLDHNIKWISLPFHNKPPVVSTLFDLYVLRKRITLLHRESNFVVVHCRSYVTSLVGLWMKRKYKVKFIFDMRGFWADERIESGLWKKSNPIQRWIYRFFKKKEAEFLNDADQIISLTKNAKSIMESWSISTPITVIPTCTDLNLFNPSLITEAKKRSLKHSLGIADDVFVLVYLGSWGTWYMTSEMLDFFSALKSKNAQAKFLILSPDEIELNQYPFAKDVIVRTVRRTEVPEYLCIATAAVAFVKPTFSKKASSATKIGELLAMNLPVITNSGWGDIDLMEYPCLVVIHDTSKVSMHKALERLFSMNIENCNLRQGNDDSLSLENGINQYEKVYQNILRSEEKL